MLGTKLQSFSGDKRLNKVADETILKDELYDQYWWFYKTFWPAIQQSCNDFFSDYFALSLVSLSKNMNVLFQGDDYFVTKIRIDRQHDVFFRLSSDSVKTIFDKVLGKTKTFDLAKITELEAKIISSFNDYLFNNLSSALLPPPPKDQKRKNFDTIHLTFFIHDKETHNGGKFIVSLPQVLLSPLPIEAAEEIFDVSDFKKSTIDVNIKVGTTRFLLKDIKNLEAEDIVVFENSDIQTMRLIYKDYENDFRVTPNPGIIASSNDNNGGNNMQESTLSQNLWDNIQVEMGAEFDKVKITLGELKNIEQGLVVDISSVYNNKISLKVENKVIATGELVIINDRYGVRIDEVFASEKNQAGQISQEEVQEEIYNEEEEQIQGEEGLEEEFDYSDFELDDQDI